MELSRKLAAIENLRADLRAQKKTKALDYLDNS